ncbi:MAG: nucleotide sugar dehydrogenase [Anaerolineae bacterium]|nr:nucleotide sugar dehydrogenase [Anaerolineae bacterium]
MKIRELLDKIQQKHALIGVIGLGYVGLPVACMFADKGFQVVGVEIRADRVAAINAGQTPIEGEEPGLAELLNRVTQNGSFRATTEYAELLSADVILLDVETPVDDTDHKPRYTALKAACQSLGPVLKESALVVVESTVAPGTVDNIVRPLLEEASGKCAGRNFLLGVCPERVMPGKLLANLCSLSRVCGGGTTETSDLMIKLYRHVVEAELDATNIITAEMVKTTENAYRDVEIAFANEVAKICEANGADVWRVRELVNKSPYRNMHLPGAGVGGHCIPKDPWLLAYAAENKVPLKLIPTARSINDAMPSHVADMVAAELTAVGQELPGAQVAVLGYAYLENSDDTRNSPSEMLVAHLKEMGMIPVVHDPWVAEYQGELLEMVRGCAAAILMVKHEAYRHLDLSAMRAVLRTPIFVDGRGFYDPETVRAAGLTYRGIGRG